MTRIQVHCSRCNAMIVWLRTKNGVPMPVDAATTKLGDLRFEPERHVSHFATCPFAEKFRHRAPKKERQARPRRSDSDQPTLL